MNGFVWVVTSDGIILHAWENENDAYQHADIICKSYKKTYKKIKVLEDYRLHKRILCYDNDSEPKDVRIDVVMVPFCENTFKRPYKIHTQLDRLRRGCRRRASHLKQACI